MIIQSIGKAMKTISIESEKAFRRINNRIRINDGAAGDTGIISKCGIRFNNANVREKNLSLSLFIQGFYNATSST